MVDLPEPLWPTRALAGFKLKRDILQGSAFFDVGESDIVKLDRALTSIQHFRVRRVFDIGLRVDIGEDFKRSDEALLHLDLDPAESFGVRVKADEAEVHGHEILEFDVGDPSVNESDADTEGGDNFH